MYLDSHQQYKRAPDALPPRQYLAFSVCLLSFCWIYIEWGLIYSSLRLPCLQLLLSKGFDIMPDAEARSELPKGLHTVWDKRPNSFQENRKVKGFWTQNQGEKIKEGGKVTFELTLFFSQ